MDRNLARERGKILWGKAGCVDLFALKEDLLKNNYFEFKAVSWCMFPVLKKGDTLKVECARAGDMKIGDIPAYRSEGRLYAHRIVDKKLIDGKNYIVTRPDMGENIGDTKSEEKVPEEEILGKITEIKSGRKIYPTEKRRASSRDIFLYRSDRAFTKITTALRKALNNSLTKIQSFPLYKWAGKKIVKSLERAINFQLVIPSQSRLEIYRYEPLHKINISELKEYKIFHIRMRLKNIPIGYASCEAFALRETYIRLPYRKIGFEEILINRAKKFLKEINQLR